MTDDIGYRPTYGTPSPDAAPDPESQIEKVITAGLREDEILAPTGEAVAKMLAKAAPMIGQFVGEEIAKAAYRRDLDDEFWTGLAEQMKRPVRELRRRYRDRVATISARVLIDPRTRQTRPEYMNDPERAMGDVTKALFQELNVAAEDAPSPPSRGRAPTGDRAGTRAPWDRAPESEAELQRTISGVLGPSGRR